MNWNSDADLKALFERMKTIELISIAQVQNIYVERARGSNRSREFF